MPIREPELYKDKIEVSLDGRQIFYLFFGGAVIVGLVFVVGVLVGRRVEARGHLDRAETPSIADPLAALDRLERSDHLSFHGALTGSEAPTDVEKAIGELEKRRASARADRKPGPPAPPASVDPPATASARPDGKPEKLDKPEARPDGKPEKLDKPEARVDGKPEKPDKAEPVTRPDTDRPRADKHDGDKKSKRHDDGAPGDARSEPRPDHAETRKSEPRSDGKAQARGDGPPDGKAEARPEAREAREAREAKANAKPSAEGKARFTLQLSSFQDRSEAEAFLGTMKSAGFQPYLTEAEVSGKGTFYRVRLGSFRSLDAANDAKAEYERTAKKAAQVMRL